MQITKDRFTVVALSFIEAEKDYDHEEIVLKTAAELASNLYEEFSEQMTVGDIEKLRAVFRNMARNTIDWTRLNRKAHPADYADSNWRGIEEAL